MDNINELLDISANESETVVDKQKKSYKKFQRDFTVFLYWTYEKLKKIENDQIEQHRFMLGESYLQFGTDEFLYEYAEFTELLSLIEYRINGKEFDPKKYENELVRFKKMFKRFFKCLNKEVSDPEALLIFSELFERCMARLGFDHISHQIFDGHIIFSIDVCSRIDKCMEQFYKDQDEYKRMHPEIISCYVTDYETYTNYLKAKLGNDSLCQNNKNNTEHKLSLENKAPVKYVD